MRHIANRKSSINAQNCLTVGRALYAQSCLTVGRALDQPCGCGPTQLEIKAVFESVAQISGCGLSP